MGNRSLFVSNPDGALRADPAALERFAEWTGRHRRRLWLVYASGRFYESVAQSVRSTALPEPDVIIAGVGTEMRSYPDGAAIAGWPRPAGGWNPRRIRAVLRRFPQLRPQPAASQSRYKLSYRAEGLRPGFLWELRRELDLAGYGVEVIYSSAHNLDVLPLGVDKGFAVEFLASRWGLARHRVIVTGTAASDRSMFLRGFRGIVVASAPAELKCLARRSVYRAKRPNAAGALEGLRYWLRRSAQAQPSVASS